MFCYFLTQNINCTITYQPYFIEYESHTFKKRKFLQHPEQHPTLHYITYGDNDGSFKRFSRKFTNLDPTYMPFYCCVYGMITANIMRIPSGKIRPGKCIGSIEKIECSSQNPLSFFICQTIK